MQITRRFTREGQDSFVGLPFVPRTSRIVNPNGSVVFEMKDILVPESWSQVAIDILAQIGFDIWYCLKIDEVVGKEEWYVFVAHGSIKMWLCIGSCFPIFFAPRSSRAAAFTPLSVASTPSFCVRLIATLPTP